MKDPLFVVVSIYVLIIGLLQPSYGALDTDLDSGANCSEVHFPFHCNDGSCIERVHFCDGTVHCNDGSDEIQYNSSIHNSSHGFECQYDGADSARNTSCLLPLLYGCDHEIDCVGGKDECGCSSTFQCDNDQCALKVHFCEDNVHCADASDERQYNGTGFQCMVTKMHYTKQCKLPDVHVCDGTSECNWGTDECLCELTNGSSSKELTETFSNEKCFRCFDRSLVIPSNHVCDQIVHCKDLSDECLCEHKTSANITALCENVCTGSDCPCRGQLQCVPKSGGTDLKCIPSEAICDDKYDCENELDESFCAMDDESYPCANKLKKIPKKFVCDGLEDCDDGSDENMCHETKFICNGLYGWLLPNVTNWTSPALAPRLNRSDEHIKKWFQPMYPYYADACDKISLCTDMEDECNNSCPGERPGFCDFADRGLRCPNSRSIITGYEVCDGQPTCNDTAPETSMDEMGCPGRFYCHDRGSMRLPIHIPEKNRCDGRQECADVSDEMNCSNETHYYCNDNGMPLFIPVEHKCDRRKDCAEGGDECENCEESPFSSDQKLIKSRVLIFFLWLIGIFAAGGNLLIIIHQMVNIFRMRTDANPVAVRNRIMVLNLAAADMLTGIYLIALGIKDATTDKYCLEDQDWRSSTTCSALGTIAVVGTEASVLILLIMTGYRLYLVHQPYEGQRLSTVIFSLVFAWIFAIILGTAPLSTMARNYFLSCVWFRTHRYLGYTCRANITEFTQKLFTYEGPDLRFSRAAGVSNTTTELTWDSMLAAQRALNSGYVPEKYFGYYSAHSVCLPRLFPDKDDDRSWSYSMFLVLLNFFAFVFILISYICIYRRTTTNRVTAASAADRAAALQRKVTRIVLTDFCCWMPICLMAFITVAGVDIGPVAYAVTAIILLPINSAMNPFLYSSLLDIVWAHMEPVRKCFGQTPCGRQLMDRGELTRSTRGGTIATASTNVASSSDSNSDNHNHNDQNQEPNAYYNAVAAEVTTKI